MAKDEEKVELLIDSVGESLRPIINEEILKRTKDLKFGKTEPVKEEPKKSTQEK